MKILIIGFSKIKYMPYLKFYYDNISAEEIHILFWNRDNKEEALDYFSNVKFHIFEVKKENGANKICKIYNFLKYRKFVKSILEKEKFDRIILLHSMPAILLSDLLFSKYSDKYIFDFRDITFESIWIYKMLIHKLVKKSYATFISSKGFKKVLPEKNDKIFISHNFMQECLKHRDDRKNKLVTSEKIRISFWGFIREAELNKKFISHIGNDARFELHYYGYENRSSCQIKKYAEDNNITNVFFHGEYIPEERYDFVCKTDIIYNFFESENMMLAVSNKFYDGVIFRIPQLCMVNSVMGDIVEKSGIGLCVDLGKNNVADTIFEYCSSFDKAKFDSNCDNVLDEILKEYQQGKEVIRRFCEG